MFNNKLKKVIKGTPLPKFGEWDVNDPASAEGLTVIFIKARNEKKTGGNPDSPGNSQSNNVKPWTEHSKSRPLQHPSSRITTKCRMILASSTLFLVGASICRFTASKLKNNNQMPNDLSRLYVISCGGKHGGV